MNAVPSRIFISISHLSHAYRISRDLAVKCKLCYPPRPSQSSLSTGLAVDAATFSTRWRQKQGNTRRRIIHVYLPRAASSSVTWQFDWSDHTSGLYLGDVWFESSQGYPHWDFFSILLHWCIIFSLISVSSATQTVNCLSFILKCH
jgi:hypothetical protein